MEKIKCLKNAEIKTYRGNATYFLCGDEDDSRYIHGVICYSGDDCDAYETEAEMLNEITDTIRQAAIENFENLENLEKCIEKIIDTVSIYINQHF